MVVVRNLSQLVSVSIGMKPVMANPDQKYSEALMQHCGGSPNALFAEDARDFVAKEKKAGRWEHGKRYEFREEIF